MVTVTNSSEETISVTKMELIADKTVYEGQPLGEESYPTVIRPGAHHILSVRFDLKDDVRTTFKTPAELRIQYRSGDELKTVIATIVGAPLDTTPR
jgi:hypothetical protein